MSACSSPIAPSTHPTYPACASQSLPLSPPQSLFHQQSREGPISDLAETLFENKAHAISDFSTPSPIGYSERNVTLLGNKTDFCSSSSAYPIQGDCQESETENLRRQLLQCKQKICDLTEERDLLRSSRNQFQSALDSFQNQMTEEHRQLKQTNVNLMAEVALLSSNQHGLERDNRRLVQELQVAKGDLVQEIEAYQRQHQETLAELDRYSINHRNSAFSQALLDEIAAERDQTQIDLDRLETRIEPLETKVNQLKSEIKVLKAKKKELEKTINHSIEIKRNIWFLLNKAATVSQQAVGFSAAASAAQSSANPMSDFSANAQSPTFHRPA